MPAMTERDHHLKNEQSEESANLTAASINHIENGAAVIKNGNGGSREGFVKVL